MRNVLELMPDGEVHDDGEIQAAEDLMTIDGILKATERTFGTQFMEEYDESKYAPVATNGPSWSSGKVDDNQGDTGPGDEN